MNTALKIEQIPAAEKLKMYKTARVVNPTGDLKEGQYVSVRYIGRIYGKPQFAVSSKSLYVRSPIGVSAPSYVLEYNDLTNFVL